MSQDGAGRRFPQFRRGKDVLGGTSAETTAGLRLFKAMAYILFRCLPIAACALAGSAGAWAAGDADLPDPSSIAFHRQMTDWSAPAPTPPAQPQSADFAARPRPERAAPPARLPYLSSRFGLRADPLGGGERMHSGIDIPGSLGSPILAADGGVVTFAGPDGGYGLMIEVDHGNGLRTRYGHLSRILVSVGSPVQRRQAIGLMGSTGRSTGSHLHFEVLRNGTKVDPLGFIGGPGRAVFVPHQTAPFIAQTAPVHISRFAQARAAEARQDGKEGCLEAGCSP